MLRTLGIVEACYGCDRWRAKAARKLGGKAVLEWVARRATECLRLDGVIVVTDSAPENRFVVALAPPDVPVFVGRAGDPLGCVLAALDEYPAEAAVRVRTDCPFIDPGLIDQLVGIAGQAPGADYVGYCSRDGTPAVLSPLGVCAEWFRAAALRRAHRHARAPADRQDVTRYLYTHREKFTLRLVQAPARIDREDVRLTLDMEEDWENTLTIFEALGPEELDWQRIAQLLDHQPALRRRMATLNRQYAGR